MHKGTEENNDKYKSDKLVSRPVFELSTSTIRNVNNYH